jgi:uncharacterized protein (TIGR02246 family)
VKSFVIALVMCSFGGALSASAAYASNMSNVEKINDLEDKFVAAVNDKNVDAIMSIYVPDESLFVFDLSTPLQYVGADAYRKNWEGFAASLGPLKFEVTDFTVAVDGKMAYSHAVHHLSATDNNGQKIEWTVRVTDVYRKIKGQWLVVHEHVSVPIDLATGKPDFASTP